MKLWFRKCSSGPFDLIASPFFLTGYGIKYTTPESIRQWPHWVGDSFPEFRIFTRLNEQDYWINVRHHDPKHANIFTNFPWWKPNVWSVALFRADADAYRPKTLVNELELDKAEAIKLSRHLQSNLEDYVMADLL